MKKLLFIALLVCIKQVNAQNSTKKVTNPKYLKATATNRQKVTVEGSTSTNANTHRLALPKSVSSSCPSSMYLTGSWNPNGVGASADATQLNSLAYNKDLNALVWTQRCSPDWSLFLTSGGIQATFITNAVPSPTHTFVTNVLDSAILFSDASTNHFGARFPGGTWLNPAGNTNYHNAYSCAMGPYNSTATGDWLGSVYVAKPLWSASAMGHTQPTFDSLYCVSGSASGPFGPTPIGLSADWFGAPNCDAQQVGNAMWSTGNLLDLSVTAVNAQQIKGGYLSKATIAGTSVVNWSIDSTSLRPNFYQGALGYLVATTPRLAFAPDGLHGYAVYIGRLATTYGNSADSAMTPIVFKTTDGGNTWTQVLAGYDWATLHPEVAKNVGCGVLSAQKTTYYGFSNGYYGVDLTVDANNVLHYVSTVHEPYHGSPGPSYTYSVDSIAIFTYNYDYDNLNYHPIVWDFMTDGTTWNTMMVDSLQSGECGPDSTSAYSAWTGPLTVGAHLTVSRTPDGKKIFYGWADTPVGTTTFTSSSGTPINPNTNPDIFVVGYDVTDTMLTAATNITNLGYCFFPYIADMSYYDSTQSAWVVPAVYTVSRYYVASPTSYPVDYTTDYYYTNCGSFTQSAFSTPAIIHSATGTTDIKQFASNNSNQVAVYPNPTNGSFVIEPNSQAKQTMQVYDVNGKLILSQTISGKTSIDASGLNEGVYNISLQSNEGVVNKRLVIVR